MTGVVIETGKLDRMHLFADPALSKIIRRTVVLTSGDAAALAPVDTGALRNSIVSESGMIDDLNGIVKDGVEYGVYQELGTSRMAAHPFMVPALEKNVRKMIDGIKDAVREMLKG
jgi:HK97 gp10 family phage protein